MARHDPVIIDAFLYHDEREILELRLAELASVVDRFVIVQADRTHRGVPHDPSPLYVSGLQITNYIATVPVDTPDPWVRERAHRAAMKDAVKTLKPNPTDIVLVSDCDEIPKASSVHELRMYAGIDQIVAFRQLHTYFRLNLVDPEPWYGTRGLSWRRFSDPRVTAVNVRNVCDPMGQHVIEDGGWHFGWCGGNERVKHKLSSFAHAELDTEAMKADAFIDACVRTRRTAHNQHQLLQVGLEFLPKAVQADPEHYRSMLA